MSDTEQPNSDAWLPEEEDHPRRAPRHPLGDAAPDDDLPARLRNWRVIAETGEDGPDADDVTTFADDAITVEVDGEFSAMTVAVAHDASDDPASDPALDPFADDPATSIPPLLDPVLVASVSTNRLAVKPGAVVELDVTLVNNGSRPAHLRVRLEGWIHSDWVTMPRMPVKLDPGQRTGFTLTIAPPRAAVSTAGRHEMLLIVQSPEYPERQTRLPLLLAIAPFDDLVLGDLQPRRLHATWAQRAAGARFGVSNLGNRQTQIRLVGQCADVPCLFTFAEDARAVHHESLMLTLDPGQTTTVYMTVRPQQLPLVGMKDRTATLRVVGSVVGKPQVPRAGLGQLRRRPLIGPPQMAVGVALALLALLGMAMLGAVGFGLTQLIATTRAARPVQAPMAPVVVVVPVNEAVPAAPVASPDGASAPGVANAAVPAVAPPAARDGNVPLVSADQVSVPGGVAPGVTSAGVGSSGVTSGAASGGPVAGRGSDMTYAQLFREIGLKYDLDWRMLAAQAYVESRFDTVAIGKDGDLGLMQVLPSTWGQWATVVDVSDPFDAYSNVLVAAAYLDYLRGLLAQRGLTDARWMLVAYNWGPDKLGNHLNANLSWDDLDPTLRQYAVDVLGIAETIPLE
ncbi:MAG: transglycosylase SLT domain-containing protein [Caldilineaceae bacterium]|nr:transglycosylase SLT domain-containing protein [Caldilineaceae bacterium]